MDSGSSAACSQSRAVCIWIMSLLLPVVTLGHMDSGSRAACESRAACTWITGLLLPVVNLGLPVLYGSRSIAADSESRGACIWILSLLLPVERETWGSLHLDYGSTAACCESTAVYIWIMDLMLPVVGLPVVILGPPVFGLWVYCCL